MAATLFALLVLSTSFSLVSPQRNVQLVPGLYIFGDSFVDGGNTQNIIQNTSKAPKYGMDLKGTLVPRWSNGKTLADFIAIYLGLPIVPPSSNMTEAGKSMIGVNYAYGGCGILPQTCEKYHGSSFDNQISQFKSTVAHNLSKTFSQNELEQHLADSIFLLSFGINDYKENYLPKSTSTDPNDFAKCLLKELAQRLQIVHGLGARKFLVNNIWPLGCTPYYFITQPDPWVANGCNETINAMISPYNSRLPPMLEELQSNLAGSVFMHADNFKFVADLKANPTTYWITNTTGPCYINDDRTPVPCQNRDEYLYFDLIHTTERANQIFALNCFNGSLCSPHNILYLSGDN